VSQRPGTVIDVLGKAEGYLKSHGCQSARLDAGLLLAHVLKTDRIQLYVDHSRPLDQQELASYRLLAKRRAASEPVAYLIGKKEFWSMSFAVDPRVLIPRPDTETLLEEVLELFGPEDESRAFRFADVGTGSGCLACALAKTFPRSQGVAIDRDPNALAVARANRDSHDLTARVDLKSGDLLEPVRDQSFDLICANLPYIPSQDLSKLSMDIRLHEPLAALDGGPDGLAPIRKLISAAPGCLEPGGWLLLEVGDQQAAAVGELCRQADFTDIHTRRDLSKTERVVVAKRSGM